MYKLMVSYNAGISYAEVCKSPTVAGLEAQAKNADASGLRWYIENPDGHMDFSAICEIHKTIILDMLSSYQSNKEAPDPEKNAELEFPE